MKKLFIFLLIVIPTVSEADDIGISSFILIKDKVTIHEPFYAKKLTDTGAIITSFAYG
ncbi:MAG: hypothetical protein LBH05_05830 [Deferribacteraceae bacterium]|nr:hypothetical protein [Deferribacteraceae bacterium]